jgi:Holliday junction resolvasome RuvABC DNA-binding subunit
MDSQEQKVNQEKRVIAENPDRWVNQASKEIQEQMDLREHLAVKANEAIQALLDLSVLEAKTERTVQRVKKANQDEWARRDLRARLALKGNVSICH